MSNFSEDTEDTFISDFSVGTNSKQIKLGSLCRGERISKYNRLINIEDELGSQSIYSGKIAFLKFINKKIYNS